MFMNDNKNSRLEELKQTFNPAFPVDFDNLDLSETDIDFILEILKKYGGGTGEKSGLR